METNNPIQGYKGFDENLQCRGFQYEVGKEYETDKAIACNTGFHFCESPFNVWGYYAPANENGLNRFCEVEGSGEIDASENNKTCCTHLKIKAEIGINSLIKAGVKFIMDRVKWDNAATNTGNYSAATNTGNYSAASVEGKESIAIVTGRDSKAKGAIGCWIVLTERSEWNGNIYPIKFVKAFKVDGTAIKPDVYYKLVDGQPVEVND